MTRPRNHPLPWLIRTVWLQILRRKDAYLLALVMFIFSLGAAAARMLGEETPAMARFASSMGYSLAGMLSGLLAALVGSAQLPSEIENRTILPVLAGPVSRGQFLAGKWISTLAAAAVLFLFCVAATRIAAPRPPEAHPLALAQAVSLKLIALAALVSMSLAFSLLLPSGAAILASLLLYFAGGALANAVRAAAGASPAGAIAALIPDFTLLDHFQRHVEGGPPLGALEFPGAAAYGLLWAAAFAGLALHLFRRRVL